jgi:predicted PolB exonuclease-like 3'-5' exonuclease
MLFRVLDIETIPDPSAWRLNPNSVKWELAPEELDKGTSVRGVGGESHVGFSLRPTQVWPPPQANKVVAVSHLLMEATLTSDLGRTYTFVDFHTEAAWGTGDEKRLIESYGTAQRERDATVVTWAGRSFDLPVLAMRALKHGLDWGWYYGNKSLRYRYSDEGHCDLMDALSDYGASRPLSLGDAAHLVGLPGKTDMDGSKVADIVNLGPDDDNQAKVARYCGHDVLQTALVFLRSRMLFGYLTLEGFRRSAKTFMATATDLDLKVDWNAYLMV